MTFRYLAAALSFLSLPAAASGFETGPQDARLLGLGGAGTAYAGSLASMFYNPALLAQQADSLHPLHLMFGGVGQVRRASFVGTDTRLRADQKLTVLPTGYLHASYTVTPRVVVGLSLSQPYGYHTRWEDNWEGRSVVQESQLTTYMVQPTVGIKLTDNFSAGAGVFYAYGQQRLRRALGQYDDQNAQLELEGSGSGVGFSLGLYGRAGDNLSFGISYRTGADLKMNNGTATFRNVPTRDAVLYPASTSLRTGTKLPNALAVGITDQVTKNLLVTFDFTLTGWGTLDSLNYDLAATDRTAAQRLRNARGYEDVLAFRVGAEYQVSPALTVRGGVRYDETPVRDEYISPDLLDANRLGGTVGLSYQLTPRLAVDAAYGFDYGAERTSRVNLSQERISNVSGNYRLGVNTAALGLSLQF